MGYEIIIKKFMDCKIGRLSDSRPILCSLSE